MSKKCCVDGCTNIEEIFHNFPLKLNYVKKSSIIGGNSVVVPPHIESVNANLLMCGEHFKKEQISPSGQLKIRVEPSLLKGSFKENRSNRSESKNVDSNKTGRPTAGDHSDSESSTDSSASEDVSSENLKDNESVTDLSPGKKNSVAESVSKTVVPRTISVKPSKRFPNIVIKRKAKCSDTNDNKSAPSESVEILPANQHIFKPLSENLKYTILVDCGKVIHSWNQPASGSVDTSNKPQLKSFLTKAISSKSVSALPSRRLHRRSSVGRSGKKSLDITADLSHLAEQSSRSPPSLKDMSIVNTSSISMSSGSEELIPHSEIYLQDDVNHIGEEDLTERDPEAENMPVRKPMAVPGMLWCDCELRVPVYLCTKCNFGFFHASLLDLHYRACSELQCYKCQCVFENLNDIYLHVIECDTYVCRHCSIESAEREQHRLHQQLCGEDVAMTCQRCDEYETLYSVDFEDHTKKCSSTRNLFIIDTPKQIRSRTISSTEIVGFPDDPLSCPRCSAELKYDDNYEQSSDSTSYNCCCYLQFTSLQALLDHSAECRLVFEEEPADMQILDSTEFMKIEPQFDNTSSIDEDSAPDEVDTINCLDKFYGEVDALFTMLKRKSFKIERDTQCSVCKKTLGSKVKLRAHLERHALHTLSLPQYVCAYCAEPFKELVWFGTHAIEKHVSRRCDYCDLVIPDVQSLELHIARDHLEYGENITCTACKEIVEIGDFITHRDQRCSQAQKQCAVCGIVVTGLQEYGAHLSTHRRAAKSVTCTVCKEIVPKEDLIAHRKKYHDSHDTMCGLCGLHKKVHVFGVCTGELQCPGCGELLDRYLLGDHSCGTTNILKKNRQFKNRIEAGGKKLKIKTDGKFGKVKIKADGKYKSPNIKPEGKEEKPKFTCLQCGKCFVKESCFSLHLKRHSGVKKPFRCNYCLTYFISMEALEGHNRALHRFQSAHCADCDLTFEDLEGYYTHRRDRHFKTKYLCCDKILSNFTIVLRHFQDDHQDDRMSIVTKLSNGKPTPFVYKLYVDSDSDHIRFACATCDTVFSNKLRVNMHITNVHIGERKFRCSHCEATYKSRSSLNSHETIHFNINPYNCRFCPQGFRTNRAWKKHELIMHENSGELNRSKS